MYFDPYDLFCYYKVSLTNNETSVFLTAHTEQRRKIAKYSHAVKEFDKTHPSYRIKYVKAIRGKFTMVWKAIRSIWKESEKKRGWMMSLYLNFKNTKQIRYWKEFSHMIKIIKKKTKCIHLNYFLKNNIFIKYQPKGKNITSVLISHTEIFHPT